MKYMFFAAFILFAACQNSSNAVAPADSSVTDTSMPHTALQVTADSAKAVTLHNGANCFLYANNKDTISMQLTLNDSAVSGNLAYNFYEKDKNNGTFTGFLKNDTLLASYTFSSEGMRSMRQVVFLLKGDILLSGNGSMKEQGNQMVFSNKQDISFDNLLILKSVDCATITVR